MRENSDEKYVLDLVSELLNEDFIWQKKFDSLLGDPGKWGQRKQLPVDAYFIKQNLIVEYREKQHYQPVKFMDCRLTVSGVPRGEQRIIYDLRKEEWAIENNIRFIAVRYLDFDHRSSGKLRRNPDFDRRVLGYLLKAHRGGTNG